MHRIVTPPAAAAAAAATLSLLRGAGSPSWHQRRLFFTDKNQIGPIRIEAAVEDPFLFFLFLADRGPNRILIQQRRVFFLPIKDRIGWDQTDFRGLK